MPRTSVEDPHFLTSSRTRIGAACTFLTIAGLIGFAAVPAAMSAACRLPSPRPRRPFLPRATRLLPAELQPQHWRRRHRQHQPRCPPLLSRSVSRSLQHHRNPRHRHLSPRQHRISLTPKDIEETWRMWGVRIGEARVAGGEGILATIYGWPVTIGEFEERKERLLISIERFRHELDQAVIAEDTSTLDEPRRVAVNSLLSAIEKYDIDAMALSSLLMEFSRYHLAVRLGKANPSDTEIVAEIQEHRTAFGEQYNRWPSDGPLWALIEGYVQAVGQERYWSEYLPMGLKRDLAVRSWIRPAYSLEKARVKVASFRPLDMGAVGANSTVLQELDAFDLSPAMKAQMRAYAEERWDIFEAGLASLEQLPSRPETYPFFPPLPTYGLLSP